MICLNNNFKKGISPVVAMSLMLVVAVSSVVFFQGWFGNFSSQLFVDAEVQGDFTGASGSLGKISSQELVGDVFYFNAGQNSTINKIEINGVECDNVSASFSGLSKINLADCLKNVSSAKANVVVFTDFGIFETYEFIDTEIVSLNSGSNNISAGDLYPLDNLANYVANYTYVISSVWDGEGIPPPPPPPIMKYDYSLETFEGHNTVRVNLNLSSNGFGKMKFSFNDDVTLSSVYVKSDCGDNDVSITFTQSTDFDSLGEYGTFPYTEGAFYSPTTFEGYTENEAKEYENYFSYPYVELNNFVKLPFNKYFENNDEVLVSFGGFSPNGDSCYMEFYFEEDVDVLETFMTAIDALQSYSLASFSTINMDLSNIQLDNYNSITTNEYYLRELKTGMFNSKLYFPGGLASSGNELMSFDGSSFNLEKNLNFQTKDSNPIVEGKSNDGSLYIKYNFPRPYKLYKYKSGVLTEMTIDGGREAGSINEIFTYGGEEYILMDYPTTNSNANLFRVDGTNLVEVTDSSQATLMGDASGFVELNGKMYFGAQSFSPSQSSFYSFNGTDVVKSYTFATHTYGIYDITKYNNEILFTHRHPTTGTEIYRSDGETYSTIVKDIIVGSGQSAPAFIGEIAGELYFRTNNDFIRKLNSSLDVIDIKDFDYYKDSAIINNKLYFSGRENDDGIGNELYIYDGSIWSNLDLKSGLSGSTPDDLTFFDDKVFFTTSSLHSTVNLYYIDNLNVLHNASELGNIGLSFDDMTFSSFYSGVDVNDFVFTGDHSQYGREVYVYDLVSNNVSLLVDYNGEEYGSDPDNFVIENGKLYLTAAEEIYEIDNSNNYNKIGDKSVISYSSPDVLHFYDGKLYFTDGVSGYGTELFRLDGNVTNLAVDLKSGSSSGSPSNLFNFEGNMYFSGESSSSFGKELYKYDGASAIRVSDLSTGSADSYPQKFTEYNGKMYFVARVSGFSDYTLVSYDGSSISILNNDFGGVDVSGQFKYLFVYDNKLFFIYSGEEDGDNIGYFDGTNIYGISPINSKISDLKAIVTNGELYLVNEYRNMDWDYFYELHYFNNSIMNYSLVSTLTYPTYNAISRTFYSLSNGIYTTYLDNVNNVHKVIFFDPITKKEYDLGSDISGFNDLGSIFVELAGKQYMLYTNEFSGGES